MGKAKKKARRLTARRKIFLAAVDALREHFTDDGLLRDDVTAYGVADCLDAIRRTLPECKSVRPRDVEACLCSALYYMHSVRPHERLFNDGIDDVHEMCVGGELFAAMYWLGRRDGVRDASVDWSVD
jgi:hypothetical protein